MADLTGLSPQGLSQLWDLPVGATYDAMTLRDQLSRNNDINQQGALQKLDYDKQMNPMLLQQQNLRNLGAEAELPGKRADSRLKTSQANVAEQTEPDHISALKAQYGDTITKAHADQATQAGVIMGSWGDWLKDNATPEGFAAIKQKMQDAGLGKFWNPLYDQYANDPRMIEMIGSTMRQVGDNIQTHTQKYMTGMDMLGAKVAGQQANANNTASNRMQLEQFKQQAMTQRQEAHDANVRAAKMEVAKAVASGKGSNVTTDKLLADAIAKRTQALTSMQIAQQQGDQDAFDEAQGLFRESSQIIEMVNDSRLYVRQGQEKPYLDMDKGEIVNPQRMPNPGAVQPPASNKPVMPKAGEIRDGYMYRSGDPADHKSWTKVE